MRIFIFLLISSTSLLSSKAQDFQVITGKSVNIDGVTSFGKFACFYEEEQQTDTLVINGLSEKPVLDISLPVNEFGCGNKMLTRDFNKTLKSKDYPFISVVVDEFIHKEGNYFSSLELDIVGKQLRMNELPFIRNDQDQFIASFEISLSYFDIEPPKKFLGLLKVHETLKINLVLDLKKEQ